MSDTPASRRRLIGSGAALLLLAPFAAGTAKAAELDGELLRLCAEMEERQADVVRINRASGASDAELDAVLDDWWGTVEDITDTPARTPEGVRAKAGAVRTAIVGTYGDRSPKVTDLLASLLSDMLGETVELPSPC
jgi:hypothetical protein